MRHVTVAQDRTIAVPPGAVVRTGYVDVFRVRHACRERMAVGDIDRAYQRRLQLGARQPFPPPMGWWEGETFIVLDGRHEHLAAVMTGAEFMLVAWLDEGGAPCGCAQ